MSERKKFSLIFVVVSGRVLVRVCANSEKETNRGFTLTKISPMLFYGYKLAALTTTPIVRAEACASHHYIQISGVNGRYTQHRRSLGDLTKKYIRTCGDKHL